MIELVKYDESRECEWNKVLNRTKIDTFLFQRSFMDYHSDRFKDFSFLVYRKNNLEGIIPGNIQNDTWWSHKGLTYGGIVVTHNVRSSEVLEIFAALNDFLSNEGVKRIYYKPAPYIYHRYPASEDLYCLFRLGAEKVGCGLASAIRLNHKMLYSNLRKRMVKKAHKNKLVVQEQSGFSEFWSILEENLSIKYNRSPVHSLDEIELLRKRFPENIKLYCSLYKNEVVGGAVMFLAKQVAHVQYIAATELGKKLGALDLLFNYLIEKCAGDFKYFDFGISTEQGGVYLNEGLLFQKEGFGARGVVYETYSYEL